MMCSATSLASLREVELEGAVGGFVGVAGAGAGDGAVLDAACL